MKIKVKRTVEVELNLADMDAEELNTLKRSILVDDILELREQITVFKAADKIIRARKTA